MEVYLIRHTSPDVEKNICYGQSDIGLAASFETECRQLFRHLPGKADVVYSSPLTRCMELAGRIPSDLPVHTDERLKELHFGSWELRKWEEIEQASLNAWMEDFVHTATPGGENFSMLYERAGAFYEELVEAKRANVCIVTHAGVIRALIARILDMPLRNAFKIPVPYGSVTKLNLDAKTCSCSFEFISRQ